MGGRGHSGHVQMYLTGPPREEGLRLLVCRGVGEDVLELLHRERIVALHQLPRLLLHPQVDGKVSLRSVRHRVQLHQAVRFLLAGQRVGEDIVLGPPEHAPLSAHDAALVFLSRLRGQVAMLEWEVSHRLDIQPAELWADLETAVLFLR